jgi:hypothetical protein
MKMIAQGIEDPGYTTTAMQIASLALELQTKVTIALGVG